MTLLCDCCDVKTADASQSLIAERAMELPFILSYVRIPATTSYSHRCHEGRSANGFAWIRDCLCIDQQEEVSSEVLRALSIGRNHKA